MFISCSPSVYKHLLTTGQFQGFSASTIPKFVVNVDLKGKEDCTVGDLFASVAADNPLCTVRAEGERLCAYPEIDRLHSLTNYTTNDGLAMKSIK